VRSRSNASVDAWLAEILEALGGVPRELGVEAARSVDKAWWNSDARLPDKNLVLRRNFDTGDPIVPWIVPERLASETLKRGLGEECGDDREPIALSNPDRFEKVRFREWLRLELEVDETHASKQPFPTLGLRVTQDDFPAIIRAIRAQNRAEFGADADRPD
jgi:hypothetical protein